MKKSLIFWFAAVTCAALFLVGCESPTNGESGADGKNIGLADGTNVSAADLAAWFLAADIVTLGPDVDTVEGVVPGGKKLIVSGTSTAVGDSSIDGTETLEIKAGGTLEIAAGASLDASYVTSTAGYLVTSGGGITGTGIVSLPYLTADATNPPEGIVTYAANLGGITKTAGSYIAVSAAAPGSALNNANLETLMGALPAGASLTVSSITGLTATAVPTGKTLTLTKGSTTLANNSTFAVAGTLNVAEGASLATHTGTATAISGTITNKGTITLANAGDTLTATGVTNNGTISTISVTPATVTGLLGLTGTGTVEIGASVTLTAAAALNQNAEVKSGATLTTHSVGAPFSTTGGKTITIGSGGTLALVVENTSVGVTVVNNGTITTATTSDALLATLLEVSESGSAITASGAITELTEDLVVPQGVTLTAANATFATGAKAVIVDGTATLASATFAAATSLTVNGELTVGTPALTAIDANTDITGTGALIAGAVADAKAVLIIESSLTNVTLATGTITAADLEIPAETTRTFTGAAAPTGDVTVNGAAVFSGAAVPAGDVTVNGALNVTSTGTFKVADTTKLTVGANGVLSVGDGTNDVIFRNATIEAKQSTGVVLTGSSGTAPFLANDVLIIAEGGSLETKGTGSATFVQTTFDGVGTWTASATGGTAQPGVSGVKITSGANGAEIALNAGSGTQTAAVLTAGGTDPTITQAAAANNVLTIAAGTTVALGGEAEKLGEIVLKNSSDANTTNSGKLSLLGTITTGNTAGDNQASGAPLSTDFTTTVSNGTTYTSIGVLYLTGDGVDAKVVATNDPTNATTSDAGKIAKLIGASGATITGGNSTTTVDGSADGKISGATETAADES